MLHIDQYEAFNIAVSKVAIINDGFIISGWKSHDIYHKPKTKFVADFIGLGVLPIKKINNEDFEIPLESS